MSAKIIFLLLGSLCCLAQGQSDADPWKKISLWPVCFEGRNDRYGFFNYLGGVPRLVAGIKLVHKSGTIRCKTDVSKNSKWGCYRHSEFKDYRLNVVVTDSNNNVIFPRPEYIKHTSGLWYWLPGVDENHSNELVFTDFAHPFYLPHSTELRVWYGEDLKNWNERDNQGKVCVDVFAHYM
ncbi:uncharacterized protein LOC116619641 [Nematostella vectensis]|uniref:uncharacterized protein LOC116619641 n=1 Tax=Nematostella vectensis TaxID=45351 RepID=UPI0020779899|nr:uncharacterized protein LOC116619641 [Nematostella vectensis]